MASPRQIDQKIREKLIARAVIYGLSRKLIAQKLRRPVSWVVATMKSPSFESSLREAEEDILKTADRTVSVLWSKSLKVLEKLLKSKKESIRLQAFDRVRRVKEFADGLGPGGVGGGDEDGEMDNDYLLTEGHIQKAMKFLEQTPKEDDFIDVTPKPESSDDATRVKR